MNVVNAQEQNDAVTAADHETARVELNALEVQLKKDDPQFLMKKKMLVPVLQPLFKTIPPNQWVERFQAAYKAITEEDLEERMKYALATQPTLYGCKLVRSPSDSKALMLVFDPDLPDSYYEDTPEPS
jgi:hypothetical protein